MGKPVSAGSGGHQPPRGHVSGNPSPRAGGLGVSPALALGVPSPGALPKGNVYATHTPVPPSQARTAAWHMWPWQETKAKQCALSLEKGEASVGWSQWDRDPCEAGFLRLPQPRRVSPGSSAWWLPNPTPSKQRLSLSHDPVLTTPAPELTPHPRHLGGREEGILGSQAVLVVRPQAQRALGQGQHQGPLWAVQEGRADPRSLDPWALRGTPAKPPNTRLREGHADSPKGPIF